MHKLLRIQLQKCFGSTVEEQLHTPEMQKFITLIEESYTQQDDDYRILEHILDVNSKELSEANNDIRKNHELLHSVTESVSDLIFYKDLEFKYIGCNQSFTRFFGRSIDDFIGNDDFDIYPAEYASLFREMDTRMLQEMHVRTNEEWVKNYAGEDRLLLTTKAPLLNLKGELFGLVGIARDITKEYQLEQELKAQQVILIQQSRNAAMGEMIGNIAHQWRQPLNALSLLLQNIIFSYETDQLNDEIIERAKSKGDLLINTMSTTIDDFRDFFKPNRAKEHFDISSSVEKTIEMLNASLRKYSIEVTCTFEENLFVDGFPNEFAQVILNIMNNAKDALITTKATNRHIRIHGFHNEKTIVLEIQDNAGGIEESILEKVFDPYFTTKEEGKGTGIGLYMSKVIIENNMHGKLSVHNHEEGAMFRIILSVPESAHA